MSNIWFVRMDKQAGEVFLSEGSEGVIFSDHGVCNPEKDEVYKSYRNKLFPILRLTRDELALNVRDIKAKLIKNGYSDLIKKERCDLAICYWIADMQVDDIVFVRTPQQRVFLCKIKSYICERCFSGLGSFSRKVDVLKEITKDMIHDDLWQRTRGHKTIERNAKSYIDKMVVELCDKHAINHV